MRLIGICDLVGCAHNVLEVAAMHRQMTIALDVALYEGLYWTIGKQRMNQFIKNLLRPHMLGAKPDDGYRAMAVDREREAEPLACCIALAVDVACETRQNLAGGISSCFK